MTNPSAVPRNGAFLSGLAGSLWLVALLAALLFALHSSGRLDCVNEPLPCAIASGGASALLLTVVLLILHRSQLAAHPVLIVLVGLCVGIGAAGLAYLFAVIGFRDHEASGIDPVSAIGATLAVVLAVTTFILQKAAADAYAEARRALDQIKEARFTMAMGARLLSVSQRCAVSASEFGQRAASPFDPSDFVGFRRDLAAAEVLSRSARLLLELQLLVVEGAIADGDPNKPGGTQLHLDCSEIVHKAYSLELDLKELHDALATKHPGAETLRRQLRRDFLLPMARLLERLTLAPDGWAGQPPSPGAVALIDELRRVRRALEEF